MTRRNRKLLISAGLVVFSVALRVASDWWEKALAKPEGTPYISADGCWRLQTFRPFWILPNVFHPQSSPDETAAPSWFVRWESAGFFRLYNNRSGQLLGESEVYELVAWGGPIHWSDRYDREVRVGMIEVGTTPADCR